MNILTLWPLTGVTLIALVSTFVATKLLQACAINISNGQQYSQPAFSQKFRRFQFLFQVCRITTWLGPIGVVMAIIFDTSHAGQILSIAGIFSAGAIWLPLPEFPYLAAREWVEKDEASTT